MNNSAGQNPVSPRKKSSFSIWAIILISSIFLLLAVGTTRHLYLVWKEKSLVNKARASLQADDYAALNSALERVLRLNPNNVEVCRLSAQAMIKLGNPKALPWLRRVLELAPGNIDDQMALAEGALRFDRNPEAAKMVKAMEPAAHGRADFQDLAGRVDQSLMHLPDAETHFAEATKLDPKNRAYRLRLAVVRLNILDPAGREKARGIVSEYLTDTEFRPTALRALIVDALRDIQPERALSMATELDALPNPIFSDRLLYLQVLRLLNTPDFQVRLADTQNAAAKNPDLILSLLVWMNMNHLSILAKDWALSLPAEATSAIPIRVEIARSFASYGDWKKLQFFLADEKWGDLDYMKRAFLARCYRERDKNDSVARIAWSEAINAAANNGEALLTLARSATQWGWTTEVEEALLQAATKSAKSTDALNALCEYYFTQRDTAGLYRTYSLLIDRNPNDVVIRNNFVNFCLLLDKDIEHALKNARELYDKEPASPVIASTYAFALFRTNQVSQALDIMKKLKPEEFKEPSVAAYYSAFLAAAGRTSEAEEFRQLAKDAKLLPEEERILNLAPAPAPTPATEGTPTPATNAAPTVDIPSATPAPAPANTPAI